MARIRRLARNTAAAGITALMALSALMAVPSMVCNSALAKEAREKDAVTADPYPAAQKAATERRPRPAAPPASVFHASQSGQRTLDVGEGGGNPFASALIEALRTPRLELARLPQLMAGLTDDKSAGRQQADGPRTVAVPDWQLARAAAGERRVALVIVVSDYSKGGANSLPGAARDAERVTAALQAAGFATTKVVDAAQPAFRAALARFSRDSTNADAAVLYTTGHGAEVDGRVHLLFGDYPINAGAKDLARHAMRLSDIAKAPRARRVNLVFYGGCRDNPFAP